MTAKLACEQIDVGIVSAAIDGPMRFYNELLGFPLADSVQIPNVGQVTRIQIGNSILRVLVPDKTPAPAARGDVFSDRIGIGYIALKISNLSETVHRVAGAGYTVSVPIRTLRPGVRVALVEDADGNTVELMEQDAA